MKTRIVPSALLVASLMAIGFACSSPKEESAATHRDPVEFDASSTTRSELGVATWGIRSESGSTVMRGYDTSGAVSVEYRQAIRRGEHRTFEATLKSNGGQVAMKAEVESSNVKMLANAFAGNEQARRVIDRIVADLDARGGGGGLLGTKSIGSGYGLRDGLMGTDGGTCLLTGCSSSLVSSAHTGANAVSACQIGDSVQCSQGVSKAANEQSQSDGQCSSNAVARAQQWVDVKMPYCGGVNGGNDALCPGTCSRTGAAKNDQWDNYRSDCSGLVSWAWGLDAPGLVTGQFAPFSTSVSETIKVDELTAGDALNNSTHIMLFAGWENDDHTKIRVLEEYDCGKVAENRTHSVTKVSDSTLNVDGWATFTAIRHTGADTCKSGASK